MRAASPSLRAGATLLLALGGLSLGAAGAGAPAELARGAHEASGAVAELAVARPARPAAARGIRRAPVLRHVQARSSRATAKPSAARQAPADPLVAGAWALRAIHAQAAWARSTGSPDVVVAVLDTGVDASHPDLAGAVRPGIDLVSDDGDPADDHGHGTMVAGLVAARAGNGIGGAGICARCSILPVKVIGPDGRGSSTDVAAGLRWAVDRGARVVNLSFVLSAPDPAVSDAIRYARERGVVVVGAAGNAAERAPVFPAAEPGVVSVAATDEADAPYPWSGQGPWVRVAAPGCAPTTVAGGSFAPLCGTSAATAVVSGLVALALSARPGADAATAVSALEAGATPIGDAVAAGRVDAAATVTLLAPPPPPAAPAARAPVLRLILPAEAG